MSHDKLVEFARSPGGDGTRHPFAANPSEGHPADPSLAQRISERTAELESANEALRAARIAAINLMEDAVRAREKAEAAEQAARESEQRYRLLFDRNPDCVFAVDATGRLILVNPACEKLSGYSKAVLLEKTFLDLIAPDQLKNALAHFERGLREHVYTELETAFLRKDGHRVEVWVAGEAVFTNGQMTVLHCTAKDITERKRAEQLVLRHNAELETCVAERTAELQKASVKVGAERQRFLDVLETLPVIVALFRPDHRVVWVNRAYREALGDNVGKLCYASQFGRDKPCEECQAFLPLQTGQPHHWEWTLPNGRTFDIYNFPFADADGAPMILEMDVDITEQRQAEAAIKEINETLERRVAERTEALAESEDLLRAVTDNSPDAIYVKDRDSRWLMANPAVLRIVNKSAEEALGKTDLQLYVDPEIGGTILENDRRVMESGRPEVFEEVADTAQGRQTFLSIKAPRRDSQGNVTGIVGISHDISERKKAELQLREDAQRLAAVLNAQREIAGANVDYSMLLQLVLGCMSRLTGAEGASLEITKGDEMVYEAATGLAAPFVGLRLKTAGSLSGRSMTSGELLRADDIETDPRVDCEACRRIGLRSMAVLPLRYAEHSFGVLKVMSPRVSAFTPEIERTLLLMGEFLGVTVARKRIEEALRRSETKYRHLFENIEEMVTVYEVKRDDAGRIVEHRLRDANSAFLRAAGVSSADDIRGKTSSEVFGKDWSEQHLPIVQKAMDTGQVQVQETYRPESGRYYITSVGRLDADTYLGTAWDITDRKRVEDALRFLVECDKTASGEDFFQVLARYLAGSLDMDFVCIDRLQEGLLVARTVAVYFDGKFEDNISYTLMDTPCGAVVQDKTCCFPSDVRHLFPKDTVLQEMKAEGYLGTILWGSQGQPIGLIAVISRKPLASHEVASYILQLVGVRAAAELERRQTQEALVAAKAAAEAANVAKSQFLASMSHELRTPMNAILGMTDLALGEKQPDTVRDYLQTSKDSADLLLELLNEILDFSRIEAGRFELEAVPFKLGKTVEQVVKTLGVRAYEKGLELVCDLADDLPEHVVGDPMRLRQVLMNLVGNAIKFTPKGEVVVQASLVERTSATATIRFSITDTGIGIPPDNLDKIFAPFTQADSSTSRRFGGTGLGLAISQRLVNMMGSEISVESKPGEVSVFSFTLALPIDEAAPEEGGMTGADQDLFRDLPVLVIGESFIGRKILLKALTSWSMRADEAPDVPTGLTRLHQAVAEGRPYRLVLADAIMPEIDGLSLVSWLRHESKLAAAVILMLSATDRQNYPEKFRDLAAPCLEKPVSRSALFNAIAKALGMESKAFLSSAGKSSGIAPVPRRLLRVLLAEDTAANQKLVRHVLGKRGHTIEIAENGRQALELLGKDDFDVVLMDVQMPEMDGFQATAEIRKLADPRKAAVPVIAMTAHALKGDRDRCLDAGMNSYVSKPVNGGELIEMVERLAAEPAFLQSQPTQPASPPADTPHAAMTVFNQEEALKSCLGSKKMLREMIKCFHEDVDNLLPQMRAALEDSDLVEVGRLGHRIKGTLAYLGAHPAKEAASRVERFCEYGDGTATEVMKVVNALERECRRLKAALTEDLSVPESKSAG
jgi:PAS domain S-box-containing protein